MGIQTKKICIIRAGDVTFISRIHRAALALQESNHYDVTLLSIIPRNDKEVENYPYKVIELTIKTRFLKSNIFFPIRVIEGLSRIYIEARKQKADIYVAITVEDLLIAYLIKRFTKTKLVYNANELEGHRKLFKSKLIQTIANKLIRVTEKHILRRADCIIAADLERSKIMEEWYNLKRVETIRNVPIYHDCQKLNLISEKLSLNIDYKILLYQGIIAPGRGAESSIIASSQINNQKFVLVLLGEIENGYKAILLNIAKKYNFDRLYFISAVPWQELLYWTSSADISMVLIENVSLSYYLAAPNKLYESIMAEVPYIASNFPEIKHVHNIANAGILVSPYDIKEISHSIERLLSDNEFIQTCKCNANVAKEVFNWNMEKKKLLSIIDNLYTKYE